MASREDEKRRRREARLAAEREQAEQAERNRRLRLGGGLGLLALIVAVVVGALVAGGGGGAGNPQDAGSADARLPARRITDLQQAAAAARCTTKNYPRSYEDRGHVPDTTRVPYRTNPPAFGKHYEIPARDGDYAGRGTPAAGHLVHSLEHGRIQVQYRRGLPRADVRGLEALFDENPDLMQVFRNATGVRDDVAVVAWTHIMRCPRFTPRVYDAIRAFRDEYKLKAPEFIPQPE